MELFVTGLHVVLCLFLILVVLLQPGKGADFGAALGGSSQDLIGAGTGVSLLGRLTALVAGLFMMTSLGLAYFSNAPADDSLDIEALEEERGAAAAGDAGTEAPGTEAPATEGAADTGDAEGSSEAAQPEGGDMGSADEAATGQAEPLPAGDAAPAGESAPAGDAPPTGEAAPAADPAQPEAGGE